MNRPNSSLDWVLSHWAHFTVLRFIILCTLCQSTEGSSGPKDQGSIPPGTPLHVTILHMHAMLVGSFDL